MKKMIWVLFFEEFALLIPSLKSEFCFLFCRNTALFSEFCLFLSKYVLRIFSENKQLRYWFFFPRIFLRHRFFSTILKKVNFKVAILEIKKEYIYMVHIWPISTSIHFWFATFWKILRKMSKLNHHFSHVAFITFYNTETKEPFKMRHLSIFADKEVGNDQFRL